MSEFVKIANVSDIPDPGKQLFEINDRLVVLFHLDGKFHCLEDLCTHDGGTLGDGEIDANENSIICPRHGAKFDIRNGKALTMPATADTISFETKVEGDEVFVQVVDSE